jgi:DNA-binding NarL/FixJ family response regulator
MSVALTRRQQDVLRLLVAGLTDPEIGDELGISTRTVETHVSSILNKLRVHARTAAVAYAVRHGLV